MISNQIYQSARAMGICHKQAVRYGTNPQTTQEPTTQKDLFNDRHNYQNQRLSLEPMLKQIDSPVSKKRLSSEQYQQKINQLQTQINHLKEASVFRFEQGDKSLKITHLGNSYWHSFVKFGEIPSNSKTKYVIIPLKTQFHDIMCGITANQFFGKSNTHTQKQSMIYRTCGSGYFYENGSSKPGKRGVKEGEVIQLIVDTAGWQISWNVDQQCLAKSVIPQQMREKKLYLVIMMYWANDAVELILE